MAFSYQALSDTSKARQLIPLVCENVKMYELLANTCGTEAISLVVSAVAGSKVLGAIARPSPLMSPRPPSLFSFYSRVRVTLALVHCRMRSGLLASGFHMTRKRCDSSVVSVHMGCRSLASVLTIRELLPFWPAEMPYHHTKV